MASSSTTLSVHKSFKYDVYLSFRGKDTRKTFIDHLYSALQQQGIRIYKDDEKLSRGESITYEIFKAIEESKFLIIVFSENYASSSWRLNELVKIMECHNNTDQRVYPVFYDVDPTEVRKQSGAFGEAFAKHNNKEEAGKWRHALKEAADLSGWALNNTANGHKAEFIKKIVEEISFKLQPTSNLRDVKHLVGMEARVKEFVSSLETDFDDALMIGITGMVGVGKTTLAMSIYSKISYQFEGSSFVNNVSEVSRKSSGLISLQRKILSDVVHHQGFTISSVFEGEIMIKKSLHNRKVLIVLDDVDHIDQLEALAGEPNWFSSGSIIIVTTRDKHVLVEHRVKLIHTVQLLSHEEAIRLFCWHAFMTDLPIQEYKELTLEVVRYAAGLPLVIQVFGSYLYCQDKYTWIDTLERLQTDAQNITANPFGASYNHLEDDCKEIFLDVACLLKGLMKDDVVRILESCGYNAESGLIVLEENFLITTYDHQYVGLRHPLIEEMGKDIVRRVHPDKPNQHSRLWIHKEIEYVLANDLGTQETKAIAVDSPVKLCSEVVTKGFGSMKNLRLLRVVSEIDDDCDEKIGQTSPNFPKALRFLSWVGYPYWSLPKTFEADNLVALEMPYSRIIQLWEGGERKILNQLRFLNLRHTQLKTLDLGLTPNLERLELEDCNHLVELVTPDGCLKRLVFLNLSGCSRIKSFMFIKRLESLEVLSLSRLYLKEFPDIIPGHYNSRLLELRFACNDIEELPSSIANLQKLVCLDFHSCRKLRSLPGSICGLQHLRNLKLYGCMLEELPEDIGHLGCLEKLNLAHTSIKHLPNSICKLKDLKRLNLSSCWNLEKLPGDVGRLECLQELVLTECTQVRDIPNSICKLKSLKHLSLLGCIHLEKLPNDLELLVSLEVLNVKGTCIRHLPRSISLLTRLNIHAPKKVLQLCGFDP